MPVFADTVADPGPKFSTKLRLDRAIYEIYADVQSSKLIFRHLEENFPLKQVALN